MSQSTNNFLKLVHQIKTKEKLLIQTLSKYQPYEVTYYQIDRCLAALEGQQNSSITQNILAVFLSSNLPLYSLMIFAIVPSSEVQQVYLKPTKEMIDCGIMRQIWQILELAKFFPNVQLIQKPGSEFVEQEMKDADIVSFTGQVKNKNNVLLHLKPNGMMLFHGSGQNPFIVGPDAQLDHAAKDLTFVRFFNTGQDCAGPDCIFVHESIYSLFMEKLIGEVNKLVISSQNPQQFEPRATIYPIMRKQERKKFSRMFRNGKVILGGKIKGNVVLPTIIEQETPSFDQPFGPIARICRYKGTNQLITYFQDNRYQLNKMYVSYYGQQLPKFFTDHDDRKFQKKNKHSIGLVLHNMTVHQYEHPKREYGGYAKGASCMYLKDKHGKISQITKPLLMNRQIGHFKKLQRKQIHNQEIISNFGREFHQALTAIFGTNIVFACAFGSLCSENLHRDSDIDTFVVVKQKNEEMIKKYRNWIVGFQFRHRLRPDLDYICEIVTEEQLKSSLQNIRKRKNLDPFFNDEQCYDEFIYAGILGGRQDFVYDPNNFLQKMNKQIIASYHCLCSLSQRSQKHYYRSIIPFVGQSLSSPQQLNFMKYQMQSLMDRKKFVQFLVRFVPFGGRKIVHSKCDLEMRKEEMGRGKVYKLRRRACDDGSLDN